MMIDFLNRIDTQKSLKKQSTINLSKKGSSHSINLNKNDNKLSFNLNWNSKSFSSERKNMFEMLKNNLSNSNTELDLDLGCIYKLKNGKKGVIQALGNSFGSLRSEPYILLDGDDRSGDNAEGETLNFNKVEELEIAIIFAFIYEGAPSWRDAKGIATIKQPGHPNIVINLNDDSSKPMVGIAMLFNKNNDLSIEKLEKYYAGHQNLDDDFGFGFNWVAGSK